MAVAERKKLNQAMCVAVSKNANSFGLRCALFLMASGDGFSALSNALNVPRPGDVVRFGHWGDYAVSRGWEVPQQLKSASPQLAQRLRREIRRRRRAAAQ